jgi:mannose-1-phosphate guanylyltransferase/phosphomannomutase
VLPDSDEAICRVYSEGMDMEIAEDLTTMYVNKVNNFKKQ